MNRLWVRLSLAYTLTVIMSVFLVLFSTTLVSQGVGLQNLFASEVQSSGGLIDQLARHYTETGSWAQVRDFWATRNRIFTLAPEISVTAYILDENRQPIDAATATAMSALESDAQKIELPITVSDVVKGYLLLVQSRLPLPPRPDTAFASRVIATLLLFSAMTGVMSIVVGAVTSRGLTAPLNRLAEAAHSLGTRKQYSQVREEGTREIRELARSFNEMTTALQQSETLRRNMVADVAHELRTPLTVLQGNLSAILDGVYPLNRDEISSLFHQTNVLNRLVNDLHELSQAEAANLPLNRQRTDLVTLLRDLSITFGAVAEAESISLSFESEAESLIVSIDPVRISQAVSNLFSNALAHTLAGGTVRLTLRRAANGHHVEIGVQDSGEGISSEHLLYIFERFYRADSSRSRKTGGAGLGLAITKALVEAHGGTIRAYSEGIAGKGSLFQITLSLER